MTAIGEKDSFCWIAGKQEDRNLTRTALKEMADLRAFNQLNTAVAGCRSGEGKKRAEVFQIRDQPVQFIFSKICVQIRLNSAIVGIIEKASFGKPQLAIFDRGYALLIEGHYFV